MNEEKKMKKAEWLLGIILCFALILILLISSFQAAMYMEFGFYEKEYKKYDVLSDLDMKMEDVMYVTHEMMAYLRGDRDRLEVITTVGGTEQDFFNEQDRIHMEDVQGLFIGGLHLRTAAIIVVLIGLVTFVCMKSRWKYILPRAFQVALVACGIATALLAFFLAKDFDTAFTKFHEIFFSNDLWMFDPAEDYMIRMLPEEFFFDMVMRIGMFFIVSLLVLMAGSEVWRRKTKIR